MAEGETHFRRSRWGDGRAAVVESEPIEPADETDVYVAYITQVAGLDCAAFFTFAQDQLVHGFYTIREEHSEPQASLNDYQRLGELLQTKYGDPVYDQIVWNNTLYQDEPSEWGMAVSVGHMRMFSQWQSKTTDVELLLVGDNYQVTLAINYRSRELVSLEDARKEQLALDDL